MYNHLKQKEKSLRKKIKVLEEEKDAANSNLIYKEYGEYVLTYANTEEFKDYKESISLELEQSIDKNFSNTKNDIHNIFMDLTNLVINNMSFYQRIAKNDTYFLWF